MTRSAFKYAAFCGLLVHLSACASIAVPPQPERPTADKAEVVTPQQFFNSSGAALPVNQQWWEGFNDEALTALIQQTLTENRELDVAAANVNIAAANTARQKLDASYSTDSGSDANLGSFNIADGSLEARLSGSLGASWEYDALGRIASAIKAAELSEEAARQARQDIAVIVSSETAISYMDLRGAQARLSVARENANTQAQSLELLRQLLENGRATQLDVSRAEAQYRTTLSDLPRFEAVIDSALSRLAALTGSNAAAPEAALLSLRERSVPLPSFASSFDVGSPQDLIRRRPDIRAAETEIARRLSLSDVQRARLFPTLVFNGDLTALFGNGNQFNQISRIGFGIGPALRWEGPDLRRVRADIDIADAQTKRAYSVYEQTVTQALADVETALSNRLNEQKRQADLTKAEMAAREALEIANLRFEEGIDDFLDVLDAQRTLLAAQDRLAENQLQILRLTILAYRELGGI